MPPDTAPAARLTRSREDAGGRGGVHVHSGAEGFEQSTFPAERGDDAQFDLGIIGGKQKADFKNQALDALHKAKAEAQAQGNIGLALNIDNFIKQNIEK